MKRLPTFKQRAQAWSCPPVDDVGYLSSAEMLEYDDDDLRAMVETFEWNRYNGWRNPGNLWREKLRIDTTSGKRVLDYGCGVGIEALQYARNGNQVSVLDISAKNVWLAERILLLHGHVAEMLIIKQTETSSKVSEQWVGEAANHKRWDVIHCAGVLHHIPDPRPTIEWMHRFLDPSGELRLMVYTDDAWRLATGTAPPDNVREHEEFDQYWRTWDPIGGYADWYDAERLTQRFGDLFEVEEFTKICAGGAYAVAILTKR